MDLSNYVIVGRYDLPEPTRTAHPAGSLLAQEASAITYNWDTDTLFIVGDGGTSVVEVSKTGQLISSMTLAAGSSPQGTDFYDPEGIAYIGGGQFVFTEERDRNLVKFTYAADTTLSRSGAQTAHLGTFVPNIGLEGVTWDPQTGGFILVKEKTPEGIFQTTIDFATDTASNGSASTVNSVDLFDPAKLNLLDFADVYALSNVLGLADPDRGNLLVLSQESGKIVETDRAGNVLSTLTIVSNPGNPLDVVAQQHEGITVDANGYIYVVSENGGGDFDHPQVWVYAPSAAANLAPTAVTLTNTTTAILENTATAARIKVADVNVTDDGLGTNTLSVSGTDAASFEVDSTGLYIKAGVVLDYETKSSYAVTVNVDDTGVGATPDASTNFVLNVTDVVNETVLPNVYISEVAPWSSGNSPVGADWFEVTNGGSAALNITGWKFDDNSNSFGASVALNGVTSIAAGESVIFIEAAPADATAKTTAFINTWFGGVAPAGLQIGTYSGSGVGLSTGGDAVNLYDSSGTLKANVAFGSSPAGPYPTFNNAAGLNNATISTLSKVGTNGALPAANDAAEIGSPGSVGRLIISEVAPWSSGNSPVGADWFEVTNTSVSDIDITGWKMDDNSGSFAAAVALSGITKIAAGESVIFIESANPTAARTAFINNWFGGNAPANLQIGTYSGSGVGLSTGGDAVNLYDSTGALKASVAFGASPAGPYATFDNAAGRNGIGVTLSQLSAAGTNAAHIAANSASETGSPGEIVAANDAPTGVNDSASGLVEDGNSLATGNVLINDTDPDLVQTTTEVLSVTGARAGTEAGGGALTAVAAATIINGTYGQLTINPNGSYSYALDASLAATQALLAGQLVHETFTYRVADAAGLTDTAQLDLTITGAYDAGDAITGTTGDDTLNGSALAETISGLAGNDTITGNGGNDSIDGGADTDTAVYAAWVGYSVTNGGATVTDIDAGNGDDGTDTLTDVEQLSFAGVIVAAAAAVNDAPIGVNDTNAGDALVEDGDGSAAGNVLTNDTDADAALGLGETKTVTGARAGNEAAGGVLTAVVAATVINGTYGQLTINVDGSWSYALDNARAATNALLAGQVATESFTYRVADAHGLIDTAQVDLSISGAYDPGDGLLGTNGNDTINGTSLGETINGLAGNDTLNGNGGADTLIGGLGADRLNGGDGNDTASYANAGSGVAASLKTNSGTFGEALGDKFSSVENLTGSGFDDVLTGNSGVNILHGGAGDDTIIGFGGLDKLFGDDGNDNFVFTGAQTYASINGGDGFDTIHAGAANTKLFYGGPIPTSIEAITGDGYSNVTVVGSNGNDVIDLTNVTLTDIVAINGLEGLDDITGSAGNDVINGGGGNDNLQGGGGDDIIRGGKGIDNLTGGAGADTFVFALSETGRTQPLGDTIKDFVSGVDKIDLSLIDANVKNGSAINDAFTYIGTSAFSGAAGELRLEQIGALYYIQGDYNGDGYGDFAINLAGQAPIAATDFIL